MSYVYWLAEIAAYDDTSSPSAVTLRYADRGYTTTSSDTPASTHFADRIIEVRLPRRDIMADGATVGRSKSGYGELILANGDGGLDDILDYGIDGRTVTVYRGEAGDAFPGSWTSYDFVCDGVPEQGIDQIRLRMRPTPSELETPFQETLYAGDNALPAGLEGESDLEAKPKPVLLGGSARNIPAVLVNSAKLIYQIHDGALDSVEDVYDRGVSLNIGLAWTSQTSGFGSSQIRGATFGEDLFVIAGEDGKLATSADGITWTSRTSDFGSLNINAVTWGNGTFVAVGESGTISSSPDGTTWTQQATGLGSGDFNSVSYGNGLFVAVAQAAIIYTSPDGATWTNRTNPFSGASSLTDVVWAEIQNDPKFVAVSATEVGTSPDGITWTLGSYTPPVNLSTVTFGNGLLVAGGGNPLGPTSILVTSPDGETWTERTSGAGTSALRAASYGDGVYILGGYDGKVSTSRDGIEWTLRDSTFGSDFVRATAYGNGLFILTGAAGKLARSTPPGEEYASQADLLDDSLAPAPGTYKVYLPGGYIRLGAKSSGLVTADATQGDTAADRTHAQLWVQALEKAGLSSGDWSATDVSAADTANNAVAALWIGPEDRPTTVEVLDRIAQSFGAWWGTDSDGVYRFQRIEDPTSQTPVLSLLKGDVKDLERLIDRGNSVPNYETVVRYDRNYAPDNSNIAASVEEAARADFGKEWREKASTDSSVQTKHLTAKRIVIDGLYTTGSDAATEAARVQALRGATRTRYQLEVEADDNTSTADLGQVAGLTYDRLGLDAGKNMYVTTVQPIPERNVILLNLWG